MSIKTPLKTHGGKAMLAHKYVPLIPDHVLYVEPYAGGLSVLLAKPVGAEVVNDLDRHLANFWTVMKHPHLFEGFERAMQSTPVSEEEWRVANSLYNNLGWLGQIPDEGLVARACFFFVSCRQSLAGRGGDFAPLSKTRTRRGICEQASAWMSAVDGLREVHERLRSVVVYNRPALDLIQELDDENTFFFLDPPYLHETRTAKKVYKHEMSNSDHRDLLRALASLKGKFMLCGYDSELYAQFALENNWMLQRFEIANQAAGGKKKRVMTECVWMNY